MATVSVKVKIPDGWELACETMRPLLPGEDYLDAGVVRRWASQHPSSHFYVIVRPAYPWPSCLRPEIVSIASDSNGKYFGYATICELAGHSWSSSGMFWSLGGIDPSLLPQVADWKQSRRIKPGHEVQS